jgi:hypothetical protein
MQKRIHITQIVPTEVVHVYSGYQEVVDTLLWGLRELGFEADFAFNSVRADARNIIFSAQAAGIDLIRQFPKDTIIYNLEQSWYVFEPPASNEGSPHIREAYHYMRQNFTFWDYSLKNVEAMLMHESPMPVHHVPIGYAPVLERIPKPDQQDIDILVYGFAHDYRIKLFQTLCDQWKRCVFACGLYGQLRDELIGRSKIVLNITGGHAESIYPIVRGSYLLANRKLVIADLQPQLYIERDMIEAVRFGNTDQIPLLCHHYLANEAERVEAEEQGYQTMIRRDIRAILAAVLA